MKLTSVPSILSFVVTIGLGANAITLPLSKGNVWVYQYYMHSSFSGQPKSGTPGFDTVSTGTRTLTIDSFATRQDSEFISATLIDSFNVTAGTQNVNSISRYSHAYLAVGNLLYLRDPSNSWHAYRDDLVFYPRMPDSSFDSSWNVYDTCAFKRLTDSSAISINGAVYGRLTTITTDYSYLFNFSEATSTWEHDTTSWVENIGLFYESLSSSYHWFDPMAPSEDGARTERFALISFNGKSIGQNSLIRGIKSSFCSADGRLNSYKQFVLLRGISSRFKPPTSCTNLCR